MDLIAVPAVGTTIAFPEASPFTPPPAANDRGETMTLVEEPTTVEQRTTLLEEPMALLAGPTTLVEVLLQHAMERPDATAYVFLRDDGKEETITFGQLARRAQAIAAQLQTLTSAGDRAILLY